MLFGSYAYGRPAPDSDADVQVVMKKSAAAVDGAHAKKIHEQTSAGFPVDVSVRNPFFLLDRLSEGDASLEAIAPNAV